MIPFVVISPSCGGKVRRLLILPPLPVLESRGKGERISGGYIPPPLFDGGA